MKSINHILKGCLMVVSLLFVCQCSQGQILKRLKEKVKQTAADRVINDVGNATEKAIDKTEDAAKKGTKKSRNGASGGEGSNKDDETTSGTSSTPSIKSYKNYDFVPGDTILFESNLADEQTGEIPSQFTLAEGQMDVQEEDGENVIHIPVGHGTTFSPRMSKENYVPEKFTIEFDFKNEKFGLNHLSVDFGNRVYYAQDPSIMPGLRFDDQVDWTLGDVDYPNGLDVGSDHPMQWHHIAIAVNKNVGKAYVDQFRVANVNNLTGKPNSINIQVDGYENSFIKNIRIAAGGIDIYKQKTTPAKIIMHGILFDVDKATLKPESMGSINQIFSLLKKDPSLKFEIDGHTDNTGEAAHNLTLSQQRGDAVKTQLVKMGIDASRLTTKGFGDTKPIADNSTPEGRANNRRVEFVRM
ncbi:MAG: OmpA family protein [Chitinophagaceae bacterium]|nr:OmpA family protein [Chitinophagaceae bacterium]